MTEDDLDWLGGLPLQQRVSLGGASVHLMHAAPTEPLSKRLHLLMAPEATLEAELAEIEADVLFVGHTRVPGLRKVGETIIVNPGSLGQPRHGTPRGTYAVWLDGKLSIRHLRCDFRITQRKLARLPLDPELIHEMQTILERVGL